VLETDVQSIRIDLLIGERANPGTSGRMAWEWSTEDLDATAHLTNTKAVCAEPSSTVLRTGFGALRADLSKGERH
jgi:hypothetical protein